MYLHSQFGKDVVKALGVLYTNLTSNDKAYLINCISNMEGKGYRVSDAIQMCFCYDEISPDLDEDVAISKMKLISSSYQL